jgi:hypothetical protein
VVVGLLLPWLDLLIQRDVIGECGSSVGHPVQYASFEGTVRQTSKGVGPWNL